MYQHRADDLRQQVPGPRCGKAFAIQPQCQGHRRVEMRARQRCQQHDQHVQTRGRRDGVRQQRDGDVAACQLRAHEAAAHHDGEQQQDAGELGHHCARCVHANDASSVRTRTRISSRTAR